MQIVNFVRFVFVITTRFPTGFRPEDILRSSSSGVTLARAFSLQSAHYGGNSIIFLVLFLIMGETGVEKKDPFSFRVFQVQISGRTGPTPNVMNSPVRPPLLRFAIKAFWDVINGFWDWDEKGKISKNDTVFFYSQCPAQTTFWR